MKILGYLSLCLIVLLLAVASFILLAPRFGWRVDAVLSGSMEPELGVGSIAVTRPATAQEIQPGDIISFYSPLNGELTSHRVIAKEGESFYFFRTKVDANQTADPFIVQATNLVGKVSFHVPCLGYVTQFVKTRWGMLLTLFIPGFIIIAIEIRNIWLELSAEKIERKYRVLR